MERLGAGSSPVSPFLYEMMGQENGAASSPKQVCRRPNIRSRTRIADSAVLTPVSGMNRRPVVSTDCPSDVELASPGFSGRLSFGESENRDPRLGSPMLMSPETRTDKRQTDKEPEVCGTQSQVKEAVSRSEQQPNLIGDFTSCHALPLISGQHQDLKTISVQTLAALISGEFADSVQEHVVIDCRYPYEYEAGHIKGAVNIYTREGLVDKFFNPNTNQDHDHDARSTKRKVIIFHCEFSSKRGPKL